jgi:TP901 family phage tail tape measure protein
MSLGAVLSLKTKGFETALAAAEHSFSKFGGVLKKGISVATKTVAAGAAAAGAAATAFVVSSVKEGAAFDKAMSQVAATMGRSVDSMTEMSDFARKMGQTTAFSATEAAEALNYMALAGYDDQKSMAMLPKVLDLAAAGNIGLANASDMVTDAQSALGLSMSQTEVLVDQMAKTSSKSNTSVAQLGEAILAVGGTAKNLKGGTKELNAVLGVLADNGVKGSEGGRALRNVILSLSAPTDKAAKQIKKLGVEVFDSSGNMRDLPLILQDLNDSMDGMTQEQKMNILSEIFNKNDMKSINALLGTSTKRWRELYTEIEDSHGAASKMAETQLDNLPGDVTKFKSALSEAKITIAEGLQPTLREFVQSGTKLITDLTDGFKEGGLKGAVEAAKKSLEEILESWKTSDNPLLQTAAQIAEKFGEVASWVVSLATDWDNTIKSMKTSGSPFSVAFALGLEFVKGLLESVIGLITDWPATVEKLKTSNNLGLMLLGGALDTIQKGLDWIIKNQGEATAAISAIIGAFVGYKSITAVSSLLNILQGTTAVSMGGAAGTSWGAAFAAKAIFALGPLVAFLATVGTPNEHTHDDIGNNDLIDANGQPTKEMLHTWQQKWKGQHFSLHGGSDYDTGARHVYTLSDEQRREMDAAEAKRREWRQSEKLSEAVEQFETVSEDVTGEALGNLIESLSEGYSDALEGDSTSALIDNLSKETGSALSDLLKSFANGDVVDPFDAAMIVEQAREELGKLLEENPIPGKVEPEAEDGAKEKLEKEIGTIDIPARLYMVGGREVPFFSGGGAGGGGGGKFGNLQLHAKGLHDVPYDNYPALLHRHEQVLTASQARKRDSGLESNSVLVDAVQTLKQELANLKIVVGKRVFGQTMVDYGGSRMKDFIGGEDSRLAAGYGS